MNVMTQMLYNDAMAELRFRFEVNEVPEHVLARFLDLLKLPHKLIGAVELDCFTSGAPDLIASLDAADLLKELVLATRVCALDWEEIGVLIEHHSKPSTLIVEH